MKTADLTLVALFVMFAVIMAHANTLSFYTPGIIVGGVVTVVLISIAWTLQLKSNKTDKKNRQKSYLLIAKALRIVGWGLLFFYISKVIFGF